MHLDSGVLILMFVVVSLLLGALVKSLPKILISPYSVVLLLAGLSIGLYSRTAHMEANLPELNQALGELALIDPHLILLLFLPTLIFESAFAMETHLFKRMFSQIAILAVPGLILTTTLTAVLAYYFFPWQWSWTVCFLFGALISATDPVAVVSLLKEVSSRKRLETLIEGESLLNDGTAIVLFTLFYGLLSVAEGAEASFNVFTISGSFLSVVLLGLLIGLGVGAVILLWVGRLFNQPIIEITLTISAAYIAYFIAENVFHVSGVVAVVALGLLLASIGRTRISPEVAGFLHHFWQMMAHIANTLIFILVGIIIASRIRLDVLEWWITLAGLYLGIQVIRALSVMVFMPLLKRIGIGINKEKAIVLVWGGLRGAVSLALALIIAQDTMLAKELGDQVLFLTAGIVVLTIVINSSTMTMVLRYLGLDKLPPAKQASLDKAKFSIKQRLLNELPQLQQNEFLQRANWTGLTKPLNKIHKPAEQQSSIVIQDEDLRIAFNRRLLETERQFYWSQFRQGALTGTATKQLVNAVEVALDGNPQISPRSTLFDFWKTPSYVRFFNHIPGFNRIIVHFSFERLALSYDTARGFIQAQEEIEKHISSLSTSKQDAQAAVQDIESNKQHTRLHIQELRENFPDLSYSLETHSAHRLMLNLERVYLDDLISEGVLDESEANILTIEVENKLAHLQQQPHNVTAKEISKQLAAMPWAKGIKNRSLAALGKLAKRQIYNSGELIYRQNRRTSSIAVVMHGKVDLICISREDIVEVGSIIGVYAFLTGRYKNCAKAVTPVELIWLDIHKLKNIIAKDVHLGEMFADHLEHETHERHE
ncbi:cation:proton antiporter [Psychromonas aquimarina]|uniref:cation:proton antiporter domain-containing protein n=1 Tax=Psychromonas aquimarina TaxID=444919 RepID=UPI00041158C7|nr:cation:proton antiporter [Psychromonas aquimarina]